MSFAHSPNSPLPPLSPILLAGIAARPVPHFILQPILDTVVKRIHRRHPALFERLSDFDSPIFVIDPVDLPWYIVMHTDEQHPKMFLTKSTEGLAYTAAMRGAVSVFIDLLEGTRDGDALFFSRELVIDGDTEAVVALRNALDDAEIDITKDLLSAFGPLSGPLGHLVDHSRRNVGAVSEILSVIHRALVGPTQQYVERQQQDISELHTRIDAIENPRKRTRQKRQTRGKS